MEYPNRERLSIADDLSFCKHSGLILYDKEIAKRDTLEILRIVPIIYRKHDILTWGNIFGNRPIDRLIKFNSDNTVLIQDVKNGQLFTITKHNLYYNYYPLYIENSFFQKLKNNIVGFINGR